MRKKIAVFTSNEGHLSIAQAIHHFLNKKNTSHLFQLESGLFNAYLPIYQFFPSGFSIPFSLTKRKQISDKLLQTFRFTFSKKLKNIYVETKPDICINTYFMFNPVLEEICTIADIPLINILTDPLSVHPLLVSPHATTNLAFDTKTVEACKTYKTNSHIQPIGWFVRESFEKTYNKQKVRKQLGLEKDTLTLLVVSGSEGTTHIMKILPALFLTEKPVHIIVACGTNTLLYKSAKALKKLYAKTDKSNTLTPLSFTKELHLYMQAADLVIGKAGPNTLFESVATHTPFFAITHISGQEDGNLDIIKNYKLGYVEESPLKATKLLRNIIHEPKQLDRFKKPIQKLATYNKQSKHKLLKIIEKFF